MPTTGYSGMPLIRKLGIKPSMKLRLIGVPGDYFGWLETDVSGQVCSGREVPDFVHLFAVDIKVCAVSPEWSGLKLVVPVAKR